MECYTFCSNSHQLFYRTSAASLFSGSSGLGLQEEILPAINYGLYCKDWLPVLSEDGEADAVLEVNVGMINHCFRLHLVRVVWVILSHLNVEYKLDTLVEAYWSSGSEKLMNQVQLVNVLLNPELHLLVAANGTAS